LLCPVAVDTTPGAKTHDGDEVESEPKFTHSSSFPGGVLFFRCSTRCGGVG
jgi:hypothetical protein